MRTNNVLVLIATHNRQESLERCLTALSASLSDCEFVVSVSNSGGAVSIPSTFGAAVTITKAPSNSFWAESMELASKNLSSASRFTHVLWLNDDVELFPDSVKNLISLMSSSEADVLVGQTVSSRGAPSYGGFVRRSKIKPLHFDSVLAGDEPIRADTFNGNIVLLGSKALENIGPFLKGYKHYLADIAYGLETTQKGLRVLVAPGALGVCEPNLKQNPALDRTVPRSERIRVLNTAPGLPIRQQWRFSIRYGGILGLVYFFATYARFFWNLAFYKKPNH
jgi:GT2 family glycosyltransferase